MLGTRGDGGVIAKASTYIVQHDSLEALLSESADSANGAPVKLDRGSDTVHARTEHHDTLVVKVDIMFLGVVRQVEIVGHSGELSGDCIDLLDDGEVYFIFISISFGVGWVPHRGWELGSVSGCIIGKPTRGIKERDLHSTESMGLGYNMEWERKHG